MRVRLARAPGLGGRFIEPAILKRLASIFIVLAGDPDEPHAMTSPRPPFCPPDGRAPPARVATALSPLAIGPGRRFGAWVVVDAIGEGGMGAVYRVRHVETGAAHALKVIKPGFGGVIDAEDLARFRREAEVLAELGGHPNVVAVHASGVEDIDGRPVPFTVMDLVDGESLARRFGDRLAPPADAVRLAIAIAGALEHAHARGIVHRDLKPENVVVGADGRPRVLDFGLAMIEAATRISRTGDVVGTPAFMAPEQIHPTEETPMGPAVDVYGLGAILYALLTGRPPFRGADAIATLTLVLEVAPERLRAIVPELDEALEAIVLKALEKDPRDRYASAAALREDLERWARGDPVAARPPGALLRLARRWPLGARGTAAFAVLIVASVAGGLIVSGRTGRAVSVGGLEAKLSVAAGRARRGAAGAIDEALGLVARLEAAGGADPVLRRELEVLDAIAQGGDPPLAPPGGDEETADARRARFGAYACHIDDAGRMATLLGVDPDLIRSEAVAEQIAAILAGGVDRVALRDGRVLAAAIADGGDPLPLETTLELELHLLAEEVAAGRHADDLRGAVRRLRGLVRGVDSIPDDRGELSVWMAQAAAEPAFIGLAAESADGLADWSAFVEVGAALSNEDPRPWVAVERAVEANAPTSSELIVELLRARVSFVAPSAVGELEIRSISELQSRIVELTRPENDAAELARAAALLAIGVDRTKEGDGDRFAGQLDRDWGESLKALVGRSEELPGWARAWLATTLLITGAYGGHARGDGYAALHARLGLPPAKLHAFLEGAFAGAVADELSVPSSRRHPMVWVWLARWRLLEDRREEAVLAFQEALELLELRAREREPSRPYDSLREAARYDSIREAVPELLIAVVRVGASRPEHRRGRPEACGFCARALDAVPRAEPFETKSSEPWSRPGARVKETVRYRHGETIAEVFADTARDRGKIIGWPELFAAIEGLVEAGERDVALALLADSPEPADKHAARRLRDRAKLWEALGNRDAGLRDRSRAKELDPTGADGGGW